MTQVEVELIAREIRTRCLHSSWSDLVDFWGAVMSNLEEAYRAVVHGKASSHGVTASGCSEMQTRVRDKLARVLSQLAGEQQVARWNAEATTGPKPSPKVKGGALKPGSSRVE